MRQVFHEPPFPGPAAFWNDAKSVDLQLRGTRMRKDRLLYQGTPLLQDTALRFDGSAGRTSYSMKQPGDAGRKRDAKQS